MTRFHKENIQCPFCLSDEEVVIWDHIDATEDPDLKERLLKKECQVLYCPNCGEESILARPLLYSDGEAGYVLAWRPELQSLLSEDEENPSSETEAQAAKSPSLDKTSDQPGQSAVELALEAAWPSFLEAEKLPSIDQGDCRLRLVVTYNDLLEKIHCFDAGLEDHALELIKLALRSRYATDEKIFFDELYFVGASAAEMQLQGLAREQGWQALNVPMELYDNALNLIETQLGQEGRWQIVDARFAKQLLTLLQANPS